MVSLSRTAVTALAALALTIAGCGSGGDPASAPERGASGGQGGSERILPAVEVVDLQAGGAVQLSDVQAGDRPLLVWFWSPY